MIWVGRILAWQKFEEAAAALLRGFACQKIFFEGSHPIMRPVSVLVGLMIPLCRYPQTERRHDENDSFATTLLCPHHSCCCRG